jgi:hypothetical protein
MWLGKLALAHVGQVKALTLENMLIQGIPTKVTHAIYFWFLVYANLYILLPVNFGIFIALFLFVVFLGPLHIGAKGHDHVIVRALESRPKAIPPI